MPYTQQVQVVNHLRTIRPSWEIIVNEDTNTITVKGKCLITGRRYSATYPIPGVFAWIAGVLIQRALPNTSVDDREWLISGVHPAVYDEMYEDES